MFEGCGQFCSNPDQGHRRDCSSIVNCAYLGDGFVPDEDVVGYPVEEPKIEKQRH